MTNKSLSKLTTRNTVLISAYYNTNKKNRSLPNGRRICSRGRNNSKMSGSQQDYLVGKSGSPQIYVVVIWPRFKQNNMTNTKFEINIPKCCGNPSDYCCHHLW